MYEIDNFKTNDEELNKFLKKINNNVRKTYIDSLTDNSHCDNNSHTDNEFVTHDHINTDCNIDNKSQVDNCNYQTDFDHNYHRKKVNLPEINDTWDAITKYAENEVRYINTTKKTKMEIKKSLNLSGKDEKLIRKLKLISRLEKKRNAKQFKQLFLSTKIMNTQNSIKCIEDTKTIKHSSHHTETKLKKISQHDNKISQHDNKSSHPDNYDDNADYEDEFDSLIETEDWDENQLKEIEVQKHIDKVNITNLLNTRCAPWFYPRKSSAALADR